MAIPRVIALSVLCLVGLPAVAQDTGTFDVIEAKLSLRPRDPQRPDTNRFSLRGHLAPSAELLALDVPASGIEVKFNDVIAFHIHPGTAGKLFREQRAGVWRLRGGPLLLKLQPTTGALRVRNRRTDLGTLADTTPQGVTVSVRFNELEYTSTVDFEPRGQTWRHRASRD